MINKIITFFSVYVRQNSFCGDRKKNYINLPFQISRHRTHKILLHLPRAVIVVRAQHNLVLNANQLICHSAWLLFGTSLRLILFSFFLRLHLCVDFVRVLHTNGRWRREIPRAQKTRILIFY